MRFLHPSTHSSSVGFAFGVFQLVGVNSSRCRKGQMWSHYAPLPVQLASNLQLQEIQVLMGHQAQAGQPAGIAGDQACACIKGNARPTFLSSMTSPNQVFIYDQKHKESSAHVYIRISTEVQAVLVASHPLIRGNPALSGSLSRSTWSII